MPLNAKNTEVHEAHMRGDLNYIQRNAHNPMLPPIYYEKAFINYTINTDTLPSYFNGLREAG